MATLVLTAVGTVVGGPIGAAIGGLIGNAIDRDMLFRPPGRSGPRLSDLSVQTSSYGTPIPQVFGTMRVAGTVIWSTDLIESRTKSSSGKGQPSTTTYSYSASFAVLLSARTIAGVGRIWADGNLLRGAAGDFKTSTTFRLHTGGEDQTADPLIASAEGATLTPAHRGAAYAVFENLQLASFGNRIPSLTFEVIADAAPVTVGGIAEAIAGEALDAAEAVLPFAGFSAYGDSTRDTLAMLAQAAGAWFAPGDDRLTMRADGAPEMTLADDGYGAKAGARGVRAVAAIDGVSKTLSVAHYDPARDYQSAVQHARRPGAGQRDTRLDLPAVVDAGSAKAIAEAALLREEVARETRTLALPLAALATRPGSRITVAGEPGRWRITDWSLEGMALTVTLTRLANAPLSAATASSGRVLSSPDLVAGPTTVDAFELPALDDAILSKPRLLIAASGAQPGWRRAALLVSADAGASWMGVEPAPAPAIMGELVTVPGAAAAVLADRANSFEVALLNPGWSLADADAAALDGGANLALVGDELLQFGLAEPLGGGRWRLSQLWRGRRGTEVAAGAQAIGDRFVLIEADTIAAADLPVATLGGTVRVLASGVGDIAEPAEASATIDGASVLPPAPVHLTVARAADGSAMLRWVRRSRAGWRWIDGVDAPLSEERETYRVLITPPTGAPRSIVVTEPMLPLGADDLAGGTVIAVRQTGSNGDSPAVRITLPTI